jgi:peptidoglycan/xylan/chitin deacetylase (PgdA/CDA1 family)
LFAFFFLLSTAMADECPGNPDALGTSRAVVIDPVAYKRLGTIQYNQTLPLDDHEVVLTFDDGPILSHTERVLDALAAECVKATFFVVGQMAKSYPAILQRAYREGHTIGTHTEHHAHLDRMPAQKAAKEISEGIASAAHVLGDRNAVAPFFRFPYLDPTSAVETYALQSGLSIWSADVHASDWDRISPEQVLANAVDRLDRKKKGILVLHDIQERTALALPAILRELKRRGYRVVHAVPASARHPKAETPADPWTPVN